MNGFSLTTMFVAPSGTLASSGSTQDLTAGQLGLFRPDYSIATSGNIAAAKYFYIAQGRTQQIQGLGSKRSDKIAAANVVQWYKTVAEDTAANQITELSGFHFKCDDKIILTLRINSNYTDIAFYNGYVKSVIASAPCCDCGENPCADIGAAEIQAVVDDLVAKLNATAADNWNGADVRLSNFISAERFSSGSTSGIRISGKPIPVPAAINDIAANLPEYDRITFRAFVRLGTDTTADFYVDDICDTVVDSNLVKQRASFMSGTAAEVRQMEKRYYSYQVSHFKHLHRNPDWNGAFESYVVDGKYYDLYYIVAKEYDEYQEWGDKRPQDFRVIVAFEAGEGGDFETALTAALGAPTNISGADVSTTTTTSTTSTTTTSTTTLIP